MAVIIRGIDIPKKHYMNGYYISDDGKVFDVSRKAVVGKAAQIPSGARLIDANKLMSLYSDRMEKVVGRYGIDSSEAGILSGAMKLLQTQPDVFKEEESE